MSIVQQLRRTVCGVAVGFGMACVCLGASAERAVAQPRMGMNAGMGNNTAAVTSRELDKWAEMLGMSEDQKDAAKTLHQAYLTEHGQRAKALQAVIKDAQAEFMETKDTSAFKEMGEKTSRVSEQMAALEKQFLDDTKALLDPRQAENWPRIERYHRRVQSLPGGMLAGESANLVSIVDDLRLSSEPSELKDAVTQYEMDLDKALLERDGRRKEMEKQSQDMMKDFDPSKMDFSKIRQMAADMRKTGLGVREVNQRHARLLAGAVPAEQKTDFDERLKRAMYPQVYRESYASKTVASALAMADLTADQKTQLEQIQTSFKRDLGTANERWAAAVTEEEKDGGGDPFMGFGKMIPGGSGEKSPSEDAEKARRDLDKGAVEKVKALLSEDQRAKLPQRESDNPWMMNTGGNDDEETPSKPAKPDKKK